MSLTQAVNSIYKRTQKRKKRSSAKRLCTSISSSSNPTGNRPTLFTFSEELKPLNFRNVLKAHTYELCRFIYSSGGFDRPLVVVACVVNCFFKVYVTRRAFHVLMPCKQLHLKRVLDQVSVSCQFPMAQRVEVYLQESRVTEAGGKLFLCFLSILLVT